MSLLVHLALRLMLIWIRTWVDSVLLLKHHIFVLQKLVLLLNPSVNFWFVLNDVMMTHLSRLRNRCMHFATKVAQLHLGLFKLFNTLHLFLYEIISLLLRKFVQIHIKIFDVVHHDVVAVSKIHCHLHVRRLCCRLRQLLL